MIEWLKTKFLYVILPLIILIGIVIRIFKVILIDSVENLMSKTKSQDKTLSDELNELDKESEVLKTKIDNIKDKIDNIEDDEDWNKK